jgi:hypothetical protein
MFLEPDGRGLAELHAAKHQRFADAVEEFDAGGAVMVICGVEEHWTKLHDCAILKGSGGFFNLRW